MSDVARRRWLVPAALLVAVAVLLALPGDLGAELRGFVFNRVVLGILVVSVASGLLAGLLAGGAVLGVARARNYSFAPPRLLAARVFRQPRGRVTPWQVRAVHLAGGVVALSALGVAVLLSSVLLAVLGLGGRGGLASGPAIGVGLGLAIALVAWAAFAYRWLPANAAWLDRPVAEVRRESVVLGVVFALVAGVTFPAVLFLASMLFFFR